VTVFKITLGSLLCHCHCHATPPRLESLQPAGCLIKAVACHERQNVMVSYVLKVRYLLPNPKSHISDFRVLFPVMLSPQSRRSTQIKNRMITSRSLQVQVIRSNPTLVWYCKLWRRAVRLNSKCKLEVGLCTHI
jgi:hypothetical protein